MPVPRGRKSYPTMLSSTLLLPLLWLPTTAICGRSTGGMSRGANASCSLLMIGMSSFRGMPPFSDALMSLSLARSPASRLLSLLLVKNPPLRRAVGRFVWSTSGPSLREDSLC